jgi:hypothetical protein
MSHKDGSKSGGRKPGTLNKTTSARQIAMAKVNAALNELGEDSLSGMKLLQEVIRSKDCPLDIRIQCSGLLLKHELPLASEQRYVATMPPSMPGESAQQQLAVWRALYDRRDDDDPEWIDACNRVLELAANRKRPETMQ